MVYASELATISELASIKIQNQQHAPTTTGFVFPERERERERNSREENRRGNPCPLPKFNTYPK
jgi:hypothetical protein